MRKFSPIAPARLAAGAAVMGATLLLAACGGSTASPSPTATATANSGGQTQNPAATSPAQSTPSGSSSPASGSSSPVTGAQTSTKLNLNTATADQFKTIPNVGDRFVREFDEYRPYTTILQFRRELGKYVSQDQVSEWEKYLYVPIDPNQSDADTLRQIPGVDANTAQQLISARPYASNDAFLTKLGQYVSAAQATSARSLLK